MSTVEIKNVQPNDAKPNLSGSAAEIKPMLVEYAVSTIHDKYKATETVFAQNFKDAAIIFAQCYHANLRDLFHNDVYVLVENKSKNTERQFKIKAELRIFYDAVIV